MIGALYPNPPHKALYSRKTKYFDSTTELDTDAQPPLPPPPIEGAYTMFGTVYSVYFSKIFLPNIHIVFY